MKKATTLAALTFLAGIGAIQLWPRAEDSKGNVTEEATLVLSTRTGGAVEDRKPLSKREIIDQFPENLPLVARTTLAPGQDEDFKIFADLGALEGEAAVDYLFGRYGKGQSAYLPMTFAMMGWLEKDMEGAIASFKGFLKGKPGILGHPIAGGLFRWKGVDFHSGLM